MTNDVRLYRTPSMPLHFVMHAPHGPWLMFPIIPGGWAQRKPFHGSYTLEAVSPQEAWVQLQAAGFQRADLYNVTEN